jgi:excisionase family DNA binding protein
MENNRKEPKKGALSEDLRLNPPQIMNAREIATYLGISERKVRSDSAIGQMPHARIGGRIIYRLRDIDRWLEKLMIGSEL